MKTQKGFIGILATLGLIALSGCGQHSASAAKERYRQEAEKVFTRMSQKVETARGIAGGSQCVTNCTGTGSNQPYWANWGNFNTQQIWIPNPDQSGQRIYRHDRLDYETQNCLMRVREINQTSDPNYFRARIVTLHSCLQLAHHFRNPFMTALYRNANTDTQQMWQWGSNWNVPASQSIYQQTLPAYSYQGQYLNQGYVPYSVQYQGGY